MGKAAQKVAPRCRATCTGEMKGLYSPALKGVRTASQQRGTQLLFLLSRSSCIHRIAVCGVGSLERGSHSIRLPDLWSCQLEQKKRRGDGSALNESPRQARQQRRGGLPKRKWDFEKTQPLKNDFGYPADSFQISPPPNIPD